MFEPLEHHTYDESEDEIIVKYRCCICDCDLMVYDHYYIVDGDMYCESCGNREFRKSTIYLED